MSMSPGKISVNDLDEKELDEKELDEMKLDENEDAGNMPTLPNV